MVEAQSDDRPSSARRKQLREADLSAGTIPMVSNFFPLERYYEASDKVLDSFVTAFEQRRLDEAFVYGMRYCTFCVEGIVKHDYYRSSTFERRRSETTGRVQLVLTKLEQVADWMDAEETLRDEQRKAILKKQQEERVRRQRQQEQRRMEEWQKRIEQQQQSSAVTSVASSSAAGTIEESALAKLQRLSQPLAPPPQKRVSFQLEDQLEPDGHHADSPDASPLQPLPPPLLPPSEGEEDEATVPTTNGNEFAPPSYNQILEQNSYFGPGAPSVIPPPTSSTPAYDSILKKKQHKPKPPKKQPQRFNIRQYIAQAHQMHAQYQQKRKIVVSALRTYQGRVGGSTNGCTVISACVVSKHLQSHGGVTDAQVVNAIDSECVPLLRTIRSKLGLDGNSLIIPSDVHDHMVDHNLLFQHKFAGAAGGNIVDPDHFGEFLKLLKGEPGTTQHLKAAATLFFREHVISIVKFPTSPTEAIYDMMDSLPTCNGKASRTRCMSFEALKVQLQWYSSHKFSDGNCTYIERNRWDDSMADFDPRVFQAFVWADLPKPKN
jgi:hypothetical protein